MGRINYCDDDDEEFPNQACFWQANCERSLNGQKGQSALKEIKAALLALPAKRLIANGLENQDGEVCAVGALAKARGVVMPTLPQVCDNEDDYKTELATVEFAQELGVPRMVAIAVVGENDDPWMRPPTPEQRYSHMLSWVQRQIRP